MKAVLAEFVDADALLEAVHAARKAGYRRLFAYTPHAVAGLNTALGLKPPRIGRFMLLGAMFGGLGTYFMEWYASVIAYPIDVGGRPLASWPLFVPPAAEMTLLFAALAGVLAFLIGCRLPELHDPLWDVDAFSRCSDDRYFLLLEEDETHDAAAINTWLAGTAACSASEVSA